MYIIYFPMLNQHATARLDPAPVPSWPAPGRV